MKTVASFFLFLLVVLSTHQNIFAQNDRYRYDNIIYQIPSGYRQETSDSLVLLVPENQSVDDAEVVFGIAPVPNAPRDLRGSLRTVVNKVEANREVIKRLTADNSGNGIALVSEASVTRTDTQVYISIYILARVGEKVNLLVFTTTNPGAVERYQRQIGEFFGSIDFVNYESSTYGRSYQAQNRGSRQRSNSSSNQQLQRNRTYANQIFLNSITNNYNNLSRSFR